MVKASKIIKGPFKFCWSAAFNPAPYGTGYLQPSFNPASYGTYGSIVAGNNMMPNETRLNVFLGNIPVNADYEGIKCYSYLSTFLHNLLDPLLHAAYHTKLKSAPSGGREVI